MKTMKTAEQWRSEGADYLTDEKWIQAIQSDVLSFAASTATRIGSKHGLKVHEFIAREISDTLMSHVDQTNRPTFQQRTAPEAADLRKPNTLLDTDYATRQLSEARAEIERLNRLLKGDTE